MDADMNQYEAEMADEMSGQLGEDEAVEVIPLDEYIGETTGDDSEEDDQQSTSNYSGIDEVVPDDAVCTVVAHEKDCFCASVHGQRWLSSGGEDDIAHVWDFEVSQTDPVVSIHHEDSVIAVAFNAGGSLLASGDMSGKIVITQLSDQSIRAELSEATDLEWMLWHKSNDILFAGDKDGMMWMWLISSTGVAQNKVYSSGADACTSGCLLPDGRRLLAGYADGTVRLWQLKDQTSVFLKCDSAVVAVAHHESHPIAAVGTEKGTVYLLSTGGESQLKKVHYFAVADPPNRRSPDDMEDEQRVDNAVECLSFSPSFPWLAAGRNDGSVYVYEVDTQGPRFLHRNGSNQAIVRTLWVLDGGVPLLVTGSVDGSVRVFDARNGSLLKEMRCGGEEVLDMTVLQRNPLRVLAACSGGAVRIFEV